MSTQIARLSVGAPLVFQEAVGDPVTNLGGAAIPAPRMALRHQVSIATLAPDGASDTVPARLTIRRQLRSLLNNTPLKMQSYVYIVDGDDPERDGWYVPDTGTLADYDGSSGLATGLWKLEQVAWLLVGHRRTNREARNIWMKDLRTGQSARDAMRWVYSADFAALPALALTVLPNGAAGIANAVSGLVVPTTSLPTGRDGGQCQLATGLADLACVSYERAESALNLSDVIVYDRRGLSGLPETGNTNFIVNPSFEHDANGLAAAGWVTSPDGWFGLNSGAVQVADSSTAAQGSQSMKVTGNGASQRECVRTILGGPFIQGVTYTASVWLKSISGATSFLLGLGTSTGDNGTQGVTATGSWAKYSVAWTPTTTESSANLVLAVNDTGSPHAFVVNVDSAMVVQGTSTAYFDGDNSDYRWAGPAGNSVSTLNPPAFGWEEVYGPDYPWSWQTAGQPADTPVLDNGLVRVRYEQAVGSPGFRVDVWDGAAYVEQGKMCFRRNGDSQGFDTVWQSANLVEYTPDRAVVKCVLSEPGDGYSREQVFVTLQRGELSVTFESYPPPRQSGAASDADMVWTPALNAGASDLNQSVAKIDSQGSGSWVPGAAGTAVYQASAGTGAGPGNSGQYGVRATLGNSNFTTSENWVGILRYPTTYNVIGPYQQTLIVQQAAGCFIQYAGSDNNNYGVATDAYWVRSETGTGYLQCQVSFGATVADQVMEAESMTLGAGTSSTADATASGGSAATSTRTTDANPHVTRATWPNSFQAVYRVFVRVKTSASTLNIYAKTGAGTGSTVTTTSTSYVWVDLGEITANGTTLEVHAWASAAATVSVDRVEAVLVQDRTRGSAIYSGSRDAGQTALYDSRQMGAVVAR